MSIVPIRGSFENPKAFLHSIAEDEDIEAFVIVIFRKDGTGGPRHLNCKARDMAFAGAVMTALALNPDIEE